jgi:hypothetical protein
MIAAPFRSFTGDCSTYTPLQGSEGPEKSDTLFLQWRTLGEDKKLDTHRSGRPLQWRTLKEDKKSDTLRFPQWRTLRKDRFAKLSGIVTRARCVIIYRETPISVLS